jgi:hypothetical protein
MATLKEFIETHPLPTLVGVAIAAATAASGLAAYVASAERTRLEFGLRQEMSTLKSRLASIERRIGADEKTYFDVSRLVLPQEQVKTLSAEFRTAGDGAFYYVPPPGDGWEHRVTSEAELMAMKFGQSEAAFVGKETDLAKALGAKTVYVWRHKDGLTIDRSGKAGLRFDKLVFFPMVVVQAIDAKLLPSLAGRIAEATSPGAKAASSTAAAGADEGERMLARERDLERAFRGDAAAVLLTGILTQTLNTPLLMGDVQASMNTVQKKGNVLYLQMSMRFPDATIEGSAARRTVVVDREVFVVTTPATVYMVQVEVPSIGGRAQAYEWVAQWLSGVRIPLS